MWCSGGSKPQVDGGKVVAKWASYDVLGAMRQLGTIADPGQEEARAPEEEREEKGLIDKAKGRINKAGGTKDNVRDELDEAAERGRREGDDRKGAAPRTWGSLAQGARTMSMGPKLLGFLSQRKRVKNPHPSFSVGTHSPGPCARADCLPPM